MIPRQVALKALVRLGAAAFLAGQVAFHAGPIGDLLEVAGPALCDALAEPGPKVLLPEEVLLARGAVVLPDTGLAVLGAVDALVIIYPAVLCT